MSNTEDRYGAFRSLLRAYVQDPANGYRPEGRDIESTQIARHCGDFWTVKITYKDKPDAKPAKLTWLLKPGPDRATFNIHVEEVAGWMWITTQLKIKALTEKASV